MDLKVISELVKMMNDSKLSSLEVESKDIRIKLEKNFTVNVKDAAAISAAPLFEGPKFSPAKEEQIVAVQEDAADKVSEKAPEAAAVEYSEIVKAPIVGTFYASPSPDKEPFATVGKRVKKGDVLCIIEAMKLMNEIESEFDGEIVEVLVKNGAMVEYGQPLFKLK